MLKKGTMREAIDLRDSAHFYPFRLLPGDIPRFWPRWDEMDRPYMVLATYGTSWTITPYPGTNSFTTNDTDAATHTWRSGCVYAFEDENGLGAALTSAGYTTGYAGEYTETYYPTYFDNKAKCD